MSAWLFLLIFLLAAGEGIAWLMLKHRSNHYLVADVAQGRPVWRENPFFMYRFFAERVAETPPPLVAAQEKDTDTLRICILGDGAARGWPDASFGIARQLETILQKDGKSRVEVLNMALREGNTHVLREVSRDLALLQPDVTVILMGNHEVAGPCGPAAGLGRFHTSSRLARLEVLCSRFRLVQAFRAFRDWLNPAKMDEEVWRGREPLSLGGRMSPEDPQLRRVHRAFRSNLKAIVRDARKHSGQVILCTVPVNLRDSAPFATAHIADERRSQENRENIRKAQLAVLNTNRLDAIAIYTGLAAENPTQADILWQLARLRAEEKLDDDATTQYFLRARDADALRLRIDSTMNDIIRGHAAALQVTLLDADQIFRDRSPLHLPGSELFWDHIHYTFHGAYEMARLISETLKTSDRMEGNLPPETDVSGALLYEFWGHLGDIKTLQNQLRRPPFRRQATHTEMMARLAVERQQVEARLSALPAGTVRQIYNRRFQATPQDAGLSMRAALYFIEVNQLQAAEKAATATLRIWPHRYDIRALLSLVKALQGEPVEQGIARIRGENTYHGYADVAAAMQVADKLREQKWYAEAEKWYRFVLEQDSWNSDAIIRLSEVLRLSNQGEEAETLLETACERNPNNPLLWEARGVLHTYMGRRRVATYYFQKAEDVAPNRFEHLYKWAFAMYQVRQYARAHPIIQMYLAAEPDDPDAIQLEKDIAIQLPKNDTPPEEKPERILLW